MADKLTNIRLMSVPLENDYKNTLYFDNVDDQKAYFLGKALYVEIACSYVRKDNFISFPKHIDTLLPHVNYVAYQNPNTANKWYYAFITRMEYVNENATRIYIETDVMQTWMFDYIIKPSFVEREHTANDELGRNTIEEGLEKGEYVCYDYRKVGSLEANRIIVGSTVNMEHQKDVGATYGGVYSGVKYYSFGTEAEVTNALQDLADEYEGAVSTLFVAPQWLADSSGGIVKESADPKYITYNLPKSEEYFKGQYTPKNNKLLCYPYRYLLATNGAGASAIYHFEEFDTNSIIFKIIGTICPGMSVRLHPMDYKGVEENIDEGLTLGKYPQCNWATDSFTNWMTQNAVNVGGSIVQTAVNTIGGAIIGGPVGAVTGAVGGIVGITSAVNEVKKADMIPPQAQGNINAGDVIASSGNNTFHFYQMSIKPEYARIIDEYLHMFGYKTHRVKVPNKNHRTTFWYTKTIDINIDGAVPMQDMSKIKDAYNNGITFWKDAANINRYDLNNYISV